MYPYYPVLQLECYIARLFRIDADQNYRHSCFCERVGPIYIECELGRRGRKKDSNTTTSGMSKRSLSSTESEWRSLAAAGCPSGYIMDNARHEISILKWGNRTVKLQTHSGASGGLQKSSHQVQPVCPPIQDFPSHVCAIRPTRIV